MKLKLYEFIDKDDNPTGIKKYIGPLFPIADEFFYAPISNGFKYIIEENGEPKVSENTKGAIIIAYNDEFLGAIETDELVKTKVTPKEVDINKIENKDYKELLEKILAFANNDDNRVYIKQFAYANYNNKIDNEKKSIN